MSTDQMGDALGPLVSDTRVDQVPCLHIILTTSSRVICLHAILFFLCTLVTTYFYNRPIGQGGGIPLPSLIQHVVSSWLPTLKVLFLIDDFC